MSVLMDVFPWARWFPAARGFWQRGAKSLLSELLRALLHRSHGRCWYISHPPLSARYNILNATTMV